MSQTRYVLSRHASLKHRSHGETLVLPERALRIGGSGGEILRLCEAPRSESEIVSALEERYPDTEGLAAEVTRFLAEMTELGGVVREERTPVHAPMGPRTAAASDTPPREDRTPERKTLDEPDRHAGVLSAPLNLIAELTYRCPLQCPYCSNPIAFRERRDALDATAWGRVFEEAAVLGVVHVGLTGGEPSTRRDLEEIVERAVAADLYTHLVTSGRPLDPERLTGLEERGLRSVQVSVQDSTAEASDRIAGTKSFDEKIALCERTVELGMALTLNCVLHRENLASVPALITLAERLGADRLELANTQYHGWALKNRAALMPTREQLEVAHEAFQAAQTRRRAGAPGPTMLFVLPDYYSERPKPCMGGWGRLAMVVDPTGRLLPCHEAGELPDLDFWNVREHDVDACWNEAPGMNAYRGEAWMPEPCRSCPEKTRDFGGCRCQAFRLLGDARLTDPACALSPDHDRIIAARAESPSEWVGRR